MTTFTQEMINVVIELLTEFGFSVNVRHMGIATFNPATMTNTYAQVVNSGLAAFFDPSNSNLSGYEESLNAQYEKRGKWFYLQTDAMAAPGDEIEYGSTKFVIVSATAIGPTAQTIFYRVMATEL